MCIVLTFAPHLNLGRWWVRILDFPKLQLACSASVLLVVGVAVVRSADGSPADTVAVVLLGLTMVWNMAHVLPFTPLWHREVPDAAAQDNDGLRVMVANVHVENRCFEDAKKVIRVADPDVLLLIEIDERWAAELSDLREAFEHRIDVPRGRGLGMALWSRHKLCNTSVRTLVSERRASIFAEIHASHQPPVRFVGLHPTPPGLDDETGDSRRDSRIRDAELLLVGKEVAQRPDEPWIVAGDFNDVAWSHTTRLFKRTSGLKDPRVGRAMLNTYHAQYPLLRYPVDQVFVSPGMTLRDMSRARIAGSDHFAVVAGFSVQSDARLEATPSDVDHREAQKLVKEGRHDAAQMGDAGQK